VEARPKCPIDTQTQRDNSVLGSPTQQIVIEGVLGLVLVGRRDDFALPVVTVRDPVRAASRIGEDDLAYETIGNALGRGILPAELEPRRRGIGDAIGGWQAQS